MSRWAALLRVQAAAEGVQRLVPSKEPPDYIYPSIHIGAYLPMSLPTTTTTDRASSVRLTTTPNFDAYGLLVELT